ncbi:hypothetical protein [Burkholderia cepacia]|uniref:hypothetical protein n=1 Tax=Burkholderia cepacia TaxID=292 RepID=UPI00158BF4EE|nr:hypothetical protein [Burkholderia cepacia]
MRTIETFEELIQEYDKVGKLVVDAFDDHEQNKITDAQLESVIEKSENFPISMSDEFHVSHELTEQFLDWKMENTYQEKHEILTLKRVDELCSKYDIQCYQVGDSCFSHTHPENEQEKWFVSTLSNEKRFNNKAQIPLADSEKEAKRSAIQMFDLEKVDRLEKSNQLSR